MLLRRCFTNCPCCALATLTPARSDGAPLDTTSATGSTTGAVNVVSFSEANERPKRDVWGVALGGWLDYRAALASDHVGIRLRGYASLPAGVDLRRERTLLFQRDGRAIQSLSIARLTLAAGDTRVHLGRQHLHTPMANVVTPRLVPYAYTAAVVEDRSLPATLLHGGWLRSIKDIASEDFLREAPNGPIPAGVAFIGARLRPDPQHLVQVYGYFAPRLLHAVHVQAEVERRVLRQRLRFGGQYVHTTAAAATAAVESDNGGADVSLSAVMLRWWATPILRATASMSHNHGTSGIARAYGGYTKLYTSSMYETAKRAGGATGLNLSLLVDLGRWAPHTKFEVIWLRTRYRDAAAADFHSLYAALRWRVARALEIYARLEAVERDSEGRDALYIRVFCTAFLPTLGTPAA